MPTSATIQFQSHQIHYYRYGVGDKVLLAFHGFGQSGSDFEPLADVMANEYTIYSFDLFYHGKSYWSKLDSPMTKVFWKDFIHEFMKIHQIDSCSLCGFSLGGKFVLATLEAHPERVKKVIFLAPDGIKTNTWYSLATYPVLFKTYFKSMIVKPHRFFNLINLAKKAGLVEKGILKFASSQMNTRKKRRRVYYAWVVFKELSFNMKKIGSIINDHSIDLQMFLGTHDKIITKKGMQKLLRHVKDYKLHIATSGHNKLIEKVAEHLKGIK
ncbi:alpha/beta hydrolase [Fulvivirga ulvae]|uniref:alpha/beta hydrolase n=1 Tax=Fulvivirga ulvae TaxID=2904245 RepID=UPI001F462B3A|nr:alpha/beta hydrolase [Fulvivirga ulvae]UII29947.1 alpha/beta hydrolase [Fulvivirga ulvae]